MMPARLLRIRSTPLRLTVILSVIFTAASLACFATTFFLVRANLTAAILSDMQQTVDTFGSTADLAELREQNAQRLSEL